MGAWGLGSFDNDEAADYVVELLGAASAEVLTRALKGVVESIHEYVETSECERGIAAAEVVAAMNGSPSTELPEEAAAWGAAHRAELSPEMVSLALTAVGRIRECSELKDLHIDSEQVEPWLAHLDELETRLSR